MLDGSMAHTCWSVGSMWRAWTSRSFAVCLGSSSLPFAGERAGRDNRSGVRGPCRALAPSPRLWPSSPRRERGDGSKDAQRSVGIYRTNVAEPDVYAAYMATGQPGWTSGSRLCRSPTRHDRWAGHSRPGASPLSQGGPCPPGPRSSGWSWDRSCSVAAVVRRWAGPRTRCPGATGMLAVALGQRPGRPCRRRGRRPWPEGLGR